MKCLNSTNPNGNPDAKAKGKPKDSGKATDKKGTKAGK